MTPETRFAPARLCASLTRGPRISATIPAVVVFPFVAETSADPSGSRPARSPSAPGSIVARILPGRVVPPPRPASCERRPAARATAISSPRRTRPSLFVTRTSESRSNPQRGEVRSRASSLASGVGMNCGPRLARGERNEREHMRLNGSSNGSTRSSALWGKPSKGETRSSALWGKGGRGSIVALVVAVASGGAPRGGGRQLLEESRQATSRRTSRRGCSMQSRQIRTPPSTSSSRPGAATRPLRSRARSRTPAKTTPAEASACASASAPLRRGRAAHRQADPQAGPAVRHRRDHEGRPGHPLELQPAALALRGQPPRAVEHPGGCQRTGDRRRRLRHPGRSLRLRHAHRREREPLVPSGQLGRRRARSRHLRGGHRSGQREPLCRRLARIQDRLHRRDGRQRAWP